MLKSYWMVLIAVAGASAPFQGAPASPIASKVSAEVAEMVAGINDKNADLATKYDAPDIVVMESFNRPAVGRETDRSGYIQAFKQNHGWHITKINDTVDVSKGGDLAVYRGTYNEEAINSGVPMTHRVDYLAGFRRNARGVWRMNWAVINPEEHSHKK